MEIHMGCTDAEQNIDSIMLIFCGVLGVLKTICFRIYAENLTNNYGSARDDYLTIKNTEHRAIMRKHAFIGRILSCFMVCFSYFSVTIYSLIPLLGDDKDNQMNITDEDIMLEYPMPSRCALEYFSVPESLHRIICFFEFIVLVLTCTCNHGNICCCFRCFSLHFSCYIIVVIVRENIYLRILTLNDYLHRITFFINFFNAIYLLTCLLYVTYSI